MNLYVDTSGFAKIVLNEPGAEELAKILEEPTLLVSAAIAYAELRAAIASAIRLGRIDHNERDRCVSSADAMWATVQQIAIERQLIERAGNLAELFALRGYDAVHMAAIQASGDPGEVRVACWDHDLRRAAGGLGYELVPERL